MNIYALYLPQFHPIKENNMWWGEGFTEWNNVRKAKPLFPGHKQPLVPLDENYYCLLDKETVLWQTDLMHQYGIDGMIYYHYYFNGKRLLEKPAENLLRWKDIQQPFFFNWANHSWYRSWEGSKELLIEQTYGTEQDWKKHFDYLLPFFKDSRYIKIDNKPVFMLYDPSFSQKNEMFCFFNQLCRDSGFKGLYLIEECSDIRWKQYADFRNNISDITEKVYITQPSCGKKLYIDNLSLPKSFIFRLRGKLAQKGLLKKVQVFNGEKMMTQIKDSIIQDSLVIPGIFFYWDNTPRHGFRGSIITEYSKSSFMNYMNRCESSDFVIVNAWNEWAEGMVLEPTTANKYKYLEWIKEWKDGNRR